MSLTATNNLNTLNTELKLTAIPIDYLFMPPVYSNPIVILELGINQPALLITPGIKLLTIDSNIKVNGYINADTNIELNEAIRGKVGDIQIDHVTTQGGFQ